jgi:hypothetical protein
MSHRSTKNTPHTSLKPHKPVQGSIKPKGSESGVKDESSACFFFYLIRSRKRWGGKLSLANTMFGDSRFSQSTKRIRARIRTGGEVGLVNKAALGANLIVEAGCGDGGGNAGEKEIGTGVDGAIVEMMSVNILTHERRYKVQ